MQNRTKNSLFISGYAAVFWIKDAHNDVILPKSTMYEESNSSKELLENIPILWNHKNCSIGHSLQLYRDNLGLKLEALIYPDSWQKDLIYSGLFNGLSIGYHALDFTYDQVNKVRYLKKIKVKEVSLVSSPSNELSTIHNIFSY